MAALAYLPRLYSAEGWEAVCPVMLVATVIVFVPMPAWVRLAAAAMFGVWLEFSDRHRAWAVPLLLLLVSRQQVSWPFLAKRPSPPS